MNPNKMKSGEAGCVSIIAAIIIIIFMLIKESRILERLINS